MKKRNQITITDEGKKWLDQGQMWMYSNNIKQLDDTIENGSLIDIISEDGEYIATGYLSKNSHITVRILTKDKNEEINRNFFKKRIRFAIDYRKTVEPNNLDNCRLIFAEADELPGLVVDRYNDILVCQISSYGLEMNKDLIYEVLLEEMKEDNQEIHGIYERNDIVVREKEGLTQNKGYYKQGDKTKTIICENGIYLHVDVENGQKTGYFLDQKENRVLLRNMSKDKRVLDCFSHTGGFALNAAYGQARDVVAVDVSQTALNQGLENAKLNHLEGRMNFVKDDVFEYLDKAKKGEFDIIVLDPPAFTKSRKTIYKAYNGYKRINMQAMKLLDKGGYLITCSCSRFMETANFEKMLREASKEVGVTLKQISVTQQSSDHPILWTMDETSYLKFYIFQII